MHRILCCHAKFGYEKAQINNNKNFAPPQRASPFLISASGAALVKKFSHPRPPLAEVAVNVGALKLRIPFAG